MNTQIALVPRITQVSHDVLTAGDPAGLGLALAVAGELHAPVTGLRAPEVSVVRATARRKTVARMHRRTVIG
ncbi:hypothetical protein SGFS_056860 [Streptomyces graminofaciens]|jgi:hypothetical protein|uniref:4-hydroxythreonine-4-phosphate dehydrogenase n=1 Tax=Streptomyces graminofaciens TaxID=68212 RepID=A0ABN5VLQ2_9ACTN|nr:hypothetical protein [Streptomyces graminofaciens]BBC34392.1 hypothetical protein SGFS_056860 [Streptomyces graminofaciens]